MSDTKKDLCNEKDNTWRRKGHIHKVKDDTCPACFGTGMFDMVDYEMVCPLCHGTGHYKE